MAMAGICIKPGVHFFISPTAIAKEGKGDDWDEAGRRENGVIVAMLSPRRMELLGDMAYTCNKTTLSPLSISLSVFPYLSISAREEVEKKIKNK